MKRGRRNMKQDALEGCPNPQPGESLMRVVALRGSNLIEVEDSDGEKTLCMLPAKFRKSMWIKIGNFVLVEEGNREKAAEAGNKVTGTIMRVLYDEHVRALRKTSFWPPSFQDLSSKSRMASPVPKETSRVSVESEEDDDEDEDGLPPLEANLNHQQPSHFQGSNSNSEDEN